MSTLTLAWITIGFGSVILFAILLPLIITFLKALFMKTRYSSSGESSKIRLVRQLHDAVEVLSKEKTGAIITIVNKDDLKTFRTDGVKIDAQVSSPLILSIFNKKSPLHDGAIVIDGNVITWAATYYKITSKSLSNKYGARHRAAMGISEQVDALTIVVSEETGGISFAQNSVLEKVSISEFQERLTQSLK